MEIKVETEPGQELLSQKSSHEPYGQPSHELTADGSDQKSSEGVASAVDYPRSSTIRKSVPPSADRLTQLSSTSYEFIGDLAEASGEAFFVDGSRYRGTWDAMGMAGAGSYRMPHDVLYEGETRDGVSHGQGSLRYPGNQTIDGVWSRGELKKFRYTFGDGLVYETENWNYCKFPDRRFYRSKTKGLNPAGRSLKTQYQPTKVIPPGCYDSGDGIFDSSTLCVTNFDQPSKIVRIPTTEEREWITKHCRKGGTEPTGYQRWLNENWSSSPPELPYRLPMSNDSPEKWWTRVFTFERDTSVALNELRRSYLDNSEEPGSRSDVSSKSEEHSKCVCVKEPGESSTEEDVCSADYVRSEESFHGGLDAFREVVCEEMIRDEYEGEEVEDLLMTVCRPPEGTYTTIRRREKPTQSFIDDSDGAENEEDKSEEEFQLEEAAIGYWEGKSSEEGSSVEWEKEADDGAESGYHFRGLSDRTIGYKSTKGEDDLSSSIFTHGKGLLDDDLLRSKKPAPKRLKPRARGAKKKTVKQVWVKAQKQHPCPEVVNAEELLRRKVGDLLFSPALEAPRSPVYLVRKECDGKLCRKSKASKYNSKCGVSAGLGNLPAKKRGPRVCGDDKKLSEILDSDKRKICSSAKPFVTIYGKPPEDLEQLIQKRDRK